MYLYFYLFRESHYSKNYRCALKLLVRKKSRYQIISRRPWNMSYSSTPLEMNVSLVDPKIDIELNYCFLFRHLYTRHLDIPTQAYFTYVESCFLRSDVSELHQIWYTSATGWRKEARQKNNHAYISAMRV